MATLEVNRFFFSFFLLVGIESPSMVIVRAWMRLKNMYMGSLPVAFESRFSRDSTNVTFVKLHRPSKLVMVSEVVVHGSLFKDNSFCLGNSSFGALLQRHVKEFPCVKDWFGARMASKHLDLNYKEITTSSSFLPIFFGVLYIRDGRLMTIGT
jgi:hypothetical protein